MTEGIDSCDKVEFSFGITLCKDNLVIAGIAKLNKLNVSFCSMKNGSKIWLWFQDIKCIDFEENIVYYGKYDIVFVICLWKKDIEDVLTHLKVF